jgi:alanine racemase
MEFGRIWAEIDLDALEHNLELVRAALQPGQKVLLAIKADAYGHGAAEIADALQNKVDMFGVAGVEEGINLRTRGVSRTPILVLSPVPYLELGALFDYHLSPTVTEPSFARLLGQEAERRRSKVKVHIEVDTGMGRTGVDAGEVSGLVSSIRSWSNLALEGIFTHFPAADSDFSFTARQIQDFAKLVAELERPGASPILKHAANSAGFLNFPAAHFDMVRPGLVVYGVMPDGYLARHGDRMPVKPVMSLRSRIVNLRQLPPGRSISYERRFVTTRDSRVAVITAGYGDGYPYALTNHGEVLVRGRRAPIVGNVCMDLTMLDVTEIPETAIGDTVTLLGAENGQAITVNELAGWAQTIPYEITCRVSPRVPRAFKRGGKITGQRNLLAGNDYGRKQGRRST